MIRRFLAYPIAAIAIGWLILGCCRKPKPVIPPPPVVTVMRPAPCELPVRVAKPTVWTEKIEDGRLAASQFMWADLVNYVLASEARMDASDACFAAQAVTE